MIVLARVATTTALLAFGSTASAAVLYDEAVSGDLDPIGSTSVNLTLGSNEISGFIPETGNMNDSDRFKFVQTAGLIVDSITLSFSGAWDTANIGQFLTAALFNSDANLFDDSFNTISSPSSISASFFDSFGPETGPLSTTTDGAIWDFQLSAGVVFPGINWTMTVVTSAKPVVPPPPPPPQVPLPASLPLMLAALGGAALLKRRKA